MCRGQLYVTSFQDIYPETMQKIYELKHFVSKTKKIVEDNWQIIAAGIVIVCLLGVGLLYNQSVRNSQNQLRQEIEELQKKLEDSNEKNNQQFKDFQKQVNDVKQTKAEAKSRLALLQSNRSRPIQRMGPNANCEQYRGLISQYSWNVEIALAVCRAESGGLASNENPTDNHKVCLGSRGLFQIGCDSTTSYHAMFDPIANVAQAYQIYSRRGWTPWSVCRYNVSCT